jgi:branched-chain amino acid transport system substrate-binding protein
MTVRQHTRNAAVATIVVCTLLSACGTRLTGHQLAAARGQGVGQAGVANGAEGTAGAAGAVNGGSAPLTGPSAAASGAASGSTGGAGSTGVGSTTTGSTTAGGTAAAKQPLILGSVGTFSGPSGAAWVPGLQAVKLWVSDVNSRGGVDGHPVKLISVDDQGDPTRNFSAVKDLVENKHAFAFIYNVWSNSESKSVLDYIRQHNIPVVGTDLSTASNLSEPTVFPQGIANTPAQEAVLRGGVKLAPSLKEYGQLTCLEAPACNTAGDLWWKLAPQLGLHPRYKDGVSIGQPDFTAQCLNAQRNQVQLLAVAVDPNSMRRLAESCQRQGYHPTYLLPSAVVAASQDGDSSFDNALGIVFDVPWTVKTGPGPASLYAARARFQPGLVLNVSSTMGWAAGKLFELGASSGLGSTPSRQRLIDRLYQVRNETLGGLAPPLTFIRGKPKSPTCWFTMRFVSGAWQEADGGRPVC